MISELTQQFYDGLVAEVGENAFGLPEREYVELQRYYHALAGNPQRRAFYRYNWGRRVEPMVHLLLTCPRREAPWRILDAGCGVGTESIFWCILRDDVDVIGVDICEERLDVARTRHSCYEHRLGKPLPLSFLQQDIFQVLESEHFDLVWTMEAISHIDPAEKFLAAVSKSIGDHGHLVISDSHILNPAMAWRILRMRWQGKEKHIHKTTAAGEIIPYAQERLFTVGQLSKMLKQVGFSSVQVQLSIFFPPALARIPWLFPVGPWIDVVLNKIPMLRNMGGIYTVVASK